MQYNVQLSPLILPLIRTQTLLLHSPSVIIPKSITGLSICVILLITLEGQCNSRKDLVLVFLVVLFFIFFTHDFILAPIYVLSNVRCGWRGTGKGLDNEKATFHNSTCSRFISSYATTKSCPNCWCQIIY